MTAGRDIFRLGYQISPIILTNGIASLIPGGMLPIVALTEASSFVNGLLQGNVNRPLDDYFAHFEPMAGSTLVSNQIGQYPFANQTVAANAIIAQPLTLSMRMVCPTRGPGGYVVKLATFSALKQALDLHNSQGGLYTIATPAFIYTNCIMLGLRDISGSESKQRQFEYQFDFQKPLVAVDTAQNLANSLMARISGQLPIDGQPTWSGVFTAVGNTISNAISSVIPTSTGLQGTLSESSVFTNQLF